MSVNAVFSFAFLVAVLDGGDTQGLSTLDLNALGGGENRFRFSVEFSGERWYSNIYLLAI